MLSHAIPRPLRRLLAWTAWCVAGLALVVVAAFLYVTFIGITVDAAFLRGRVAQAFSENLGRDVRFDGPMEFEVSARPKLRVGGLHIANPPGFGGGDYASLGEARLALDLWPLLFRKQLHIQELSGSDVHASLQLRADGTNNWTLRRPPPAPRPATTDAPAAVSADEAIAALDIQSVRLDNLQVRYTGPEGREHFFTLANLEARSRAGQPFSMRLQGSVEKEFPYRLEFTGGALADLARDRPWPVDMKLTFLSSTLVIHGEVNGARGRVTFGLGTENLLEFQRMLQARLPDVGASGIAGTVEFEPRRVRITQLAGAMGATSLIGHLDFDGTGSRPRISGELALPALDLRPFLGEKPAPDERAQQPANLGDVYRSIAAATFSLKQMGSADLDLTLAVQRWLSLPGDVRDVTLQLKLERGVLHAPLGAAIAGVQLKGSVDTDATAEPPRFRLALGTSDSDLGGLAELLAGVRGIRGHLGRFALRLSAQGDQGAELVRSLDIGLDVERGRFSYGNVEGGRPVEFALDKLALRLPAGKALDADMRG
ncbi:MAG TPA: AsmA family protein, partial [Burkholderiales bacterium]|nr:AsmA family protein [Burkholderiales bacterium]